MRSQTVYVRIRCTKCGYAQRVTKDSAAFLIRIHRTRLCRVTAKNSPKRATIRAYFCLECREQLAGQGAACVSGCTPGYSIERIS